MENTVLKEKWENTMLEEWQKISPRIEQNVAKIKSHLTVANEAVQTLSWKFDVFKESGDATFLEECNEIITSLNYVISKCSGYLWS